MNPRGLLPANPFDNLVVVDFETFYSDDYGLSKLTTEAYVRDPRFEMIGCGVKVNDGPAVWTDERGLRAWLPTVDWSRTACLAHHAHFDGLILSHHFGVTPAFWFDTKCMGNALQGVGPSNRLEDLAPRFGVGVKGDEVKRAKGKHVRDFTPAEYAAYGGYCCNDVEITFKLLHAMLATGFPEIELWHIDTTIRHFTEPFLVVDRPLLEGYLQYETERKAELYKRVGMTPTNFREQRGEKLASVFRSLGVEPERKPSPTHECKAVCQKIGTLTKAGKPHKCSKSCVCAVPCPLTETYAFARTDPAMQALLEHHDDEVRWLAEGRIAAMSNINETRTKRLLDSASRGPVPVYLKYSGAHTHRHSGGDKMNFQNLERA